MKLNENNVSQIRETIGQSKISIASMKEDILDHLCCAVEYRIEKGLNLDEAFDDSLHELAPRGLDEIEKETYLLLNPKFFFMKRLMYGPD